MSDSTNFCIKKRPGRQPVVSDDVIYENLKNLNLFHSYNKLILKPELDTIWEEACSKLDHKIKKHHLYERIRQNRNKILEKLANAQETFVVEPSQLNPVASNSFKTVNIDESLDFFFEDEHFKPLLKEMSTAPLHVFYRWHQQIDTWKYFSKCSNLPIVLTFIEESYFQEKISNITVNFSMCLLMSKVDDKLIPFWQGIMSRDDVDFIQYFICEWLRESVPAPKCILIPFSTELFDAVSLSFNHSILADYVVKCFQLLLTNSNNPFLCVIKVDTTVLLQQLQIILSSCFQNEFKSVQDFYLTAIIYLTHTYDFIIFKIIVENLFYLLQSKDQNEKMKKARNDVLTKLRPADEKELRILKEKTVESNKKFETLHNTIITNEVFEYFCEMQQKVLCELSQSPCTYMSLPNPYYNLQFLQILTNILIYFPVWTNVMLDQDIEEKIQVQEVTRQYTEQLDEFFSSNGDTHSIMFDDFLKKHIESLKSSFNNCTEIVKNNKCPKKALTDSQTFHNYLNLKENWMGKGGDVNLKKNQLNKEQEICVEPTILEHLADEIIAGSKNNFSHDQIPIDKSMNYMEINSHSTPIVFKNCKTVDQELKKQESSMNVNPSKKLNKYCMPNQAIKAYYNNNRKVEYKEKLIKNGSKLPNRKWKSKSYSFSNSSSFDSIAELIVHSIHSYKEIRDEIINLCKYSTSTLFLKTINDYANDGKLLNLYKNRLLLLLNVGCENNNLISCPDSIDTYFKQFFRSCTSFVKVTKCNFCCTEIVQEFSNCITHAIDHDTENFLNSYFNDTLDTCETCSNISSIRYDIKNYIAIITNNFITKLNELTTLISIKNKIYFLAGLISFVPPQSLYSEMHYVTYCYNSKTKIWKMYDSLEDKVKVVTSYKNEIKVALLFYVH